MDKVWVVLDEFEEAAHSFDILLPQGHLGNALGNLLLGEISIVLD